MKKGKIKPCPFCGCKADIVENRFGDLPIIYEVQCMVCGARIPSWCLDKEMAIDMWNRRVKHG